MENFGSEIGQKMRSAVRAKLLELGTGGSTGYIDDELPDYVMIMVANKRSKQQMVADLNLFLGSQTELFVTWLHEVLQKLQEVTLPAASAKKRKAGVKDDTISKKDKKTSKRDKKHGRKTLDESNALLIENDKPTTTTSAAESAHVIGSITDVFADVVLEKAKKSVDVSISTAMSIKKAKVNKSSFENQSDSQENKKTNDFNIPTISEISSTTGSCTGANHTDVNQRKDIAEFAELQKKIYAAKKHLKQLGELNGESDDDDFLNLKDDGVDDLNEICNMEKNLKRNVQSWRAKSPIIFSANEGKVEQSRVLVSTFATRKSFTPPPIASASFNSKSIDRPSGNSSQQKCCINLSRQSRERDSERHEMVPIDTTKRSVRERLGKKSPIRESTRVRRSRQGKILYIPTFRRREFQFREKERCMGKQKKQDIRRVPDDEELDRGRRNKNTEVEQRLRSTQKQLNEQFANQLECVSHTKSKTTEQMEKISLHQPQQQRQRIGSRVIVAPPKQVESSDEEEDKPVNSIIKIKPRPAISPSKQACKNLLLRAVAEAQRSTILTKPKLKASVSKVDLKLSKAMSERNTNLYTKSYRNRLKHNSPPYSSALLRRTTENLVIEVESCATSYKRRRMNSHNQQTLKKKEEEYVPEIVSDRIEVKEDFIYVPQSINNESSAEQASIDSASCDEDAEDEKGIEKHSSPNTQFVVTLNDDKAPHKYAAGSTCKHSRSVSPLPQVSSSSSASHYYSVEATSTTNIKYTCSREPQRRTDKHNFITKTSLPNSPSTATRFSDRESENSPPSTPPPLRQTDFIEIYQKPKDIKKIIIKNDSEDEDVSPKKVSSETQRRIKNKNDRAIIPSGDRSMTPPNPPSKRSENENKHFKVTSSHSPSRQKRSPIKFDFLQNSKERANLDLIAETHTTPKCRSKSADRQREPSLERRCGEDRKKISTRTIEAKKYENIPSLNFVTVDTGSIKVMKTKERCKYHPNCTKQFCDFYHPTAPCKSFPNCKFADKCMYSHPKCKYDISCTNIDCNFSHNGPRIVNALQSTAPPLSSHVVPVQNYKSISISAVTASAMCKYYPNCTKIGCSFYHPKPCRFGKNCINKLECNFYHHEVQSSSKFKWVASVV